ncbi:MAG: PEGA domain-containing protein [Treponema sp.]|nr:PEGA domain-containing protein [Treponema sp.]
MTTLRTGFLFLILLCLPFLLAARDTANNSRDSIKEITGRGLEINTDQQGVKVFIDGIERGITPLSLDNLQPGEYNIRLNKEGFKERNFNITVFNFSRLLVFMEMEESRGTALVSIHTGELVNKILYDLQIGYRTITAEIFGWETTSITLLIEEDITKEIDIFLQPAVLKLENLSQSRKRFNPQNPGSLGIIEYRFSVSAPGFGSFTIMDTDNNVIYFKELESFTSRIQQVQWNGRDSEGNFAAEGFYTVIIEVTDETELLSLNLETEINYNTAIFPMFLENGIAGLVFTPLPHVLPKGSYQLDAGILFGDFGLPFKTGLRFSPFENFELTSAFNITPGLENETGWSISGSVKYNFFNKTGFFPLALSAGASYTWAADKGEYPLDSGKGVGFYSPISLELKQFSFVICPIIFWHGPEGLSPDFLLSAGILYRNSWLTSGLSAKYEFGLPDKINQRFLTGAEINIFPSIFIFSLHGGIRIQNSNTRGYCGLKIGFIY